MGATARPKGRKRAVDCRPPPPPPPPASRRCRPRGAGARTPPQSHAGTFCGRPRSVWSPAGLECWCRPSQPAVCSRRPRVPDLRVRALERVAHGRDAVVQGGAALGPKERLRPGRIDARKVEAGGGGGGDQRPRVDALCVKGKRLAEQPLCPACRLPHRLPRPTHAYPTGRPEHTRRAGRPRK